MPPHTILYFVSMVMTIFIVCSIAVSCAIGYAPPELPNLKELKENVTIRQMLVGLIFGAIPFLNIVFAIAAVFLIIINLGLALFCACLSNSWLDTKPFKSRNGNQGFNAKDFS